MKRLLVVDRNPNIRRLLRREFMSEGYRVFTAANEQELFKTLDGLDSVDLMIMDTDIFDNSSMPFWDSLQDTYANLPVIVHTLSTDPQSPCPLGIVRLHVEKNWESINQLKKAVGDILNPPVSG